MSTNLSPSRDAPFVKGASPFIRLHQLYVIGRRQQLIFDSYNAFPHLVTPSTIFTYS